MFKAQKKSWASFHKKLEKVGKFPKYPQTIMVKTLFGNYLEKKISFNKKTKVVDVGCGFGNNLIPFLDIGCQVYGVEINNDICKITNNILKNKSKKKPIIKIGNNREIPFKSNYFDLLITNTLHYEENHNDVDEALKEYQRVLKPNGTLYLETTAPKHNFFLNSKKMSKNIYINKDKKDKIRCGKTFFFFENEKFLQKNLKKYFKNVITGRVTEKIKNNYTDFFLSVSCSKFKNE